MAKENYTDLLEALSVNSYVIIIAVLHNGELIDWVPASEYCTLKEAREHTEWPVDAELKLFYGLDALVRFFSDEKIEDFDRSSGV